MTSLKIPLPIPKELKVRAYEYGLKLKDFLKLPRFLNCMWLTKNKTSKQKSDQIWNDDKSGILVKLK